jgi:two-component system, OmpR family, response regulator
MRLLICNIDQELTKKFEEDNLYIIDYTEDLEDALYHIQVRFYNLVLIQENTLQNCINILNDIESTSTAFVILTDNHSKEFELQVLKKGALSVLKTPISLELLMAKIESIHRDNFKRKLTYKEYFGIDQTDKEIFDPNNNEIDIRGKAFDVLLYLVKNKHRPPISKDELIYALWEDPEMVCQNVIEVNINQIRSKLKKRLDVDIIDTVRNRGYKLKN